MGKGFRPLEEDPSSLQMKEDVKDRWIRSFRPPEGDPSSLQSWKLSWRMGVLRVSVPTRGTHLLYLWKFQHVILVGGSVPTKEPHLLYYLNRLLRQWRWVLSFRPLEGDPSSLLNSYAERSSSDFISAPTKGIHLLYFVSKGSRTKSCLLYTSPSPRD